MKKLQMLSLKLSIFIQKHSDECCPRTKYLTWGYARNILQLSFLLGAGTVSAFGRVLANLNTLAYLEKTKMGWA